MRTPCGLTEGTGRFRMAGSLSDFVASPLDSCISWEQAALWCADNGFFGVTSWGHVRDQDTRRLDQAVTAVLDSNPHERWPRRTSLFDASATLSVEPHAFENMRRHFQVHGPRYVGRLVRQAMVRPSGLTGSVFAGFFAVSPAPFETATFTAVADAARWLGRDDQALVLDIEDLRGRLTGGPPVVSALRRYLVGETLCGATLPSAARGIGLSPRTLQRRLSEAGTSFQWELNAAQVSAARALLANTNEKLTAIALEVGCASLQHLSRVYRRVTGESPSTFRARARAHRAP